MDPIKDNYREMKYGKARSIYIYIFLKSVLFYSLYKRQGVFHAYNKTMYYGKNPRPKVEVTCAGQTS